MTALPQRMYRDPLEVLEQAERRTCKGCIHSKTVLGKQYCNKGKKHGKRCKFYEEKV